VDKDIFKNRLHKTFVPEVWYIPDYGFIIVKVLPTSVTCLIQCDCVSEVTLTGWPSQNSYQGKLQ
jgi:hypothetical protein